MPDAVSRPVSTYRLQFSRRFRFADARALLPYLTDLGVTDCYSSPILQATAGSTHGYDICDHSHLNPELGTEQDYAGVVRGARRPRGFGHIVDFVPNHMSCDPTANPWWRDVLENGPSSPFARYFDIDWDPVKPELKGKVLLPLLGDQYGRVLERGELRLRVRGRRAAPALFRSRPSDQSAPVAAGARARSRATRGSAHGDDPAVREYLSILTALQNLPAYTEQDATRIVERQREKEVARERLVRLVAESPPIKAHIEPPSPRSTACPAIEPASIGSIRCSSIRPIGWPTGGPRSTRSTTGASSTSTSWSASGWRSPACSRRPTACSRELIAAGQITGLRVDHPDGLFDPAGYFAAPAATGEPGAAGGGAVLRRGREDPLGRRVAPRRLAGRRHDRLRLSQPRVGTVHRRPARPPAAPRLRAGRPAVSRPSTRSSTRASARSC